MRTAANSCQMWDELKDERGGQQSYEPGDTHAQRQPSGQWENAPWTALACRFPVAGEVWKTADSVSVWVARLESLDFGLNHTTHEFCVFAFYHFSASTLPNQILKDWG